MRTFIWNKATMIGVGLMASAILIAFFTVLFYVLLYVAALVALAGLALWAFGALKHLVQRQERP